MNQHLEIVFITVGSSSTQLTSYQQRPLFEVNISYICKRNLPTQLISLTVIVVIKIYVSRNINKQSSLKTKRCLKKHVKILNMSAFYFGMV